MHFDSRTQAALREVGLSTDDIERASDLVVESVADDADRIESFFGNGGRMYSDMDLAHSAGDVAEHEVAFLDLYTHAADLRGYLRFDGWGVFVEGGRVLSEAVVVLSVGPTVHDRVRFAREGDAL
jgi:hypothetical protein